MKLFNDEFSNILVKQMDACTLRQRVLANNIANVNTPGFKKSEVNFQQQLKAALNHNAMGLRVTNQRHIGAANNLQLLKPEVLQTEDTSMRAGKNNVDIDEEMVNTAANTLLYRLTTRVNSDRANLISYVIKGGR
ncbi:flagellar basal-body rod protein FlgB [Desulfotomaculum arcticum]|uniref:Flagellar basal body rod protein FlgB n=1 Tax=Desulfotruncus arcticus DSM 17038 TaxID=1121424 RepID=A0A1I2MW08_9FIRM|nr:flagellar basal body rod protein FlgB [Desulfotruncus arcticus]SFF95765.1 flagellar basal-body rod protein FlgB [Desulfotomaculum arcticum] [Desulfotruncus arcticus DSM 17038]